MILATLIFILNGVATPGARADEVTPPSVYGERPGYTSDVDYEKNSRSHEMVMLNPPKDPDRPLTEIIFDEKLSKEFQQQYAYKFGVTQAEQVINAPGRYDEYTYNTGKNATISDVRAGQQKFGEYMMRRLTEYHFDNYMKHDRSLRKVYEIKDRVSNLNVKTKSGWKVKWKYNLSGPTADITVSNPYDVEMQIRVQMSGLVSSPSEVIYRMGYVLSPRYSLSALIKQMDGIYQLVLTRKLTAHLSTSLTGSIDTKPFGPTIQQNLALVGLSWSE